MNPSTTTIHPTAIIDPGASIGEGTKIWHFSHVMPDSIIGKNCSLGQNVVMMSGASLGDNVKVQNNVSIYTGVHCEDDVFLGPSMVFTNVINPRSAIVRKHEYKPTYVRKGATIGANATILCGIEIGEYAFIGAGAVVTKHVPAYALVMGNPARQTGWMSRNGYKLKFDENGIGVCPESGETYVLKDGYVNLVNLG
ncbi:MAG: acyltransferase [Saprospiraceae bacterium]